MDGDIVEQGVELMIFGMGTVVVFLTVLIFVTIVMSRVVQRYFPEEVEAPVINAGRAPQNNLATQNQTPPIAVITAAIHQHRAKKK